MNESIVNALLSLLGSLHESSDISFTSELKELPNDEKIEVSLYTWFTGGINHKTKTPYTFADWHVKVKKIDGDLNAAMSPVLMKWCFDMSFNPSVKENHSTAKTAAVNILLEHLLNVVGLSSIHEIFVDPPCWYEASWQDFVFKSADRTWILHLGVSD
jgi:hypothetical protein